MSSSQSSHANFEFLVGGELMTCFYRNVTRLRSGPCYRKSVCRLSCVTFVYFTWGVETLGNISSPFCTFAILLPPCKILRWSSQGIEGNPSVEGVKRKRGNHRATVDLSKAMSTCHVRVSHLLISFLLLWWRLLETHFIELHYTAAIVPAVHFLNEYAIWFRVVEASYII